MEAVAKRPASAVGPPLKTLEAKVRKELILGDKAGYVHYRKAGELLIEAKDRFDSAADFYEWAESKFDRSKATLGDYMRFAQRVAPGEPARLDQVVRPNRDSHQPDWHRPVQQILGGINPARMAQEVKDSKKEREMIRALGYQLIDIGFKALATKLHPDKSGGSKEAMQRLNEVKRILRGAL